MDMLRTFVRRFVRDERGAALAEYAAIFLVLAVAGTVVLITVGGEIANAGTAIDTWINTNVDDEVLGDLEAEGGRGPPSAVVAVLRLREKMMRTRGLLLLVIGLFLAGGSVLVAHSYLQKMTARPGEAQAKEVTAIVVARGEIQYGAPIRFEMLRLQEWPTEAIPPEAFTSLEEVLGTSAQQPRRARRSMVAGEPVLRSKVSEFGEKVTIADMHRPTKRAMAIRVNDVSGVAGFVTPGDRVDVLLTRRLDGDNMITTTVLQDIVVRGTDQLADEDLDKPNVARTVTVEVSPEEAQRVALAQEAGTLSLTLRNLATTEKAGPARAWRQRADGEPVEKAGRRADRDHHPGRRAVVRNRTRRLTRPATAASKKDKSMSVFTLRSVGAFAAAVALAASDAGAQDQASPPRPLIPAPAAADAGGVRSPVRLRDQARAGELLVPINKSQVIEVDRAFAEVSVGNPAIADVVPLTRRTLYVFGKQLGTTSLTITDDGGDLIAVSIWS